MSFKQGHETQDSYMDNIKVKISERYKPPPRINLAMTYAQRLTLNKQIQDNMPNYEFLLEKTVLEKMQEWKSVRTVVAEERKARLEKVREELKKTELELAEQERVDEVQVKTVNEAVTVPNTNFNSTSTNIFDGVSINQNYNYSTSSSILIPTQVSNNYSNILTPIPLTKSINQQYIAKPADKSPLNFSDFENDTSSPFDNMELKSINDMEELAQVLKREESKYKTNNTVYSTYQGVQCANVPSMTTTFQTTYPSYAGYTYNIPNSGPYVEPVKSNFTHINGYYYPPNATGHNQQFHNSYLYSDSSALGTDYTSVSVDNTPLVETKKSNCKSVPDLIKSLEAEMENSRIDNTEPSTSYIRNNGIPQTSRPKSTEAIIYPRDKAKTEELDNPFNSLLHSEQNLCRSISSMGFPLSRVARACKVIGDDHKKIVEHLLALSDLLDLGFSEKNASNALLECDNDRDKALDKLIS
ncbi:hypothetical protein NQ317_008269 [Molorchus minor]|uniref:UBA domain-containing protein n=1 Tax=Molorchus minor TaxID=1323400 RepID=A0ABQ9J8K1_9CUCU|nr:hypothetical protein NQ317_008269 [Molorchus minor]